MPALPDTTNRFPGVVRLDFHFPDGTQHCSGTLVSCRDVLTAQHCLGAHGNLAASVDVTFSKYFLGERADVSISAALTVGVNVFPRSPELLPDAPFGDGDLMVVRLAAGSVPDFVRPNPIFAGNLPDGDALAVGYGQTQGPESGSCDLITGDRRYGPIRRANLATIPGTTTGTIDWIRRDPEEGGPVPGDSGGPLLVGSLGTGNPLAVAAVFSFYADATQCVPDGATYVDVRGAAAFLASVLVQEPDTDGDGVPDSCDSCKNRSDLDLCPDDAATPNVPRACAPCGCNDRDSDGDGLCDGEDACPNVASSQQVDTNLASEEVHTPELLWPDVCDPVPSPAALAIPEDVALLTSSCGSLYCTAEYRTLSNRFSVTPVRSNAAPSFPASSLPVPGVTTHARFCPSNGGGPDCGGISGISDDRLDDASTLAGEERSHPYHRITFVYGVAFAPFLPFFRGVSRELDFTNAHAYDATNVYGARWFHQLDYEFWLGRGPQFIALPAPSSDPDLGTAASLTGVLWLHADTPVGASGADPTGFHGAELANSHLDVTPEQRVIRLTKLFRTLRPTVIWMQPDPAPVEPVITVRLPTWGDRPRGEARYALFDASQGTFSMLAGSGAEYDISRSLGPRLAAALAAPGAVALRTAEPMRYSTANATTAVVLSADATVVLETVAQRDDGSIVGGADDLGVSCPPGKVIVECADFMRCAVPCDGVIGNDPDSGLGEDPTCFLAAAPASEGLTDESDFACLRLGDPPARCGAGQLACASACFTPCDGAVGCTPNGQFSDEQPELCGPGTGGPGGGGGLVLPALPQARTGWAGTYSRTLDQAFVAGGDDASGVSAGDLWVGEPRGHFVELAPRGTFGDVLGVTCVASERAVYVLHERAGGGPFGRLRRAVLTRVDPFDGALTEIGAWLRLGLFEKLELGADRDGTLLVFGSSERRDRHVVVRIDPQARSVRDVVLGRHPFFTTPVVDASGYLMVTEARGGRLHYRHPRALRGLACAWAELGHHL